MHHVHRGRTRCDRAFLGDWILDRLEAPTARDEDRTGFALEGEVLRLVLADGAGGMTGGRFAATFAVEEALARPPDVASIEAIDHALADRGQTTLVTLALDRGVRGASVGDSRAWARSGGAWRELTAEQARKPLVGSGRARAVGFSLTDVDAVAITSDGLLDVREAELLHALEQPDLLALIDRVREEPILHDDVSLLLARRR